jgi:hypothetical protein
MDFKNLTNIITIILKSFQTAKNMQLVNNSFFFLKKRFHNHDNGDLEKYLIINKGFLIFTIVILKTFRQWQIQL